MKLESQATIFVYEAIFLQVFDLVELLFFEATKLLALVIVKADLAIILLRVISMKHLVFDKDFL